MKLQLVFALALLAIVEPTLAQNNWELAKDKNGIRVYTAKESLLKVKTVKVEAVFTGTLQKLVDVLMDVDNTKNWVYKTKEAYTIQKISPTEVVYYNQTSLPWPVSNRDVPIRMKLEPNFRNNTMKVVSQSVPQAIPEKKGVVRIQHFTCTWDVTFDGKNKLSITYLLEADPGGSLSPTIVNMFITKGPFETFNNLAQLLR